MQKKPRKPLAIAGGETIRLGKAASKRLLRLMDPNNPGAKRRRVSLTNGEWKALAKSDAEDAECVLADPAQKPIPFVPKHIP